MDRLPQNISIDILVRAYLCGDPEGSHFWTDYDGCNPFRTVVPLVCRRWYALVHTPAAARIFFRRLRVVDACVSPKARFSADALLRWFHARSRYIQELEVDLSDVFFRHDMVRDVTAAVVEMIESCEGLRVLRLRGRLQLGPIFRGVEGSLSSRTALRSLHVAGGAANWEVEVCMRAIGRLPALEELQVVFSNDGVQPANDIPDSIAALRTLRQLTLTYPLRSALPPSTSLPESLAKLTRLEALQLRRIPTATPPTWLGQLQRLKHLCWDPYLPADVPGSLPAGIEALSGLETLVCDLTPPLAIPASLASLRVLVVVVHGVNEAGPEPSWDWLLPLRKLRSLRIQGGGMRSVPPGITALQLTRLGLSANTLTDLPVGPWTHTLQHAHLGTNRFTAFPAALRQATALRTLLLANQSAPSPPPVAAPADSTPSPPAPPLGEREAEDCAASRQGARNGSTPSSPRLSRSSPAELWHATPAAVALPVPSAGSGSGAGSPFSGAAPRLDLSSADVAALLAMPDLCTLIMGIAQPRITLEDGSLRDFEWLQRLLRRHGARLTANELAYEFQPMSMFETKHIDYTLEPEAQDDAANGGASRAASLAGPGALADALSRLSL